MRHGSARCGVHATLRGRAAGLVAVAALILHAPAARAAFERSPLDARSAALGGIVAVSEDPIFGNPAAAARARPALHAAFDVARPFGLPELSEAQAGIASVAPWGWAVGARRFGAPPAYAETEARVALARARGPAALGGAFRFLEVDGTGFAPRRSAALDVALRWEVEPGMVLGAVAEAVLGEVPGDLGGEGRRTAFGVARRLGPFHLLAEAQRREPAPLSVGLGVAWEPTPDLLVALGAREDPPAVSAGFTLPVPGAAVSLAGTWIPPLGTTLRVGVRLRHAPSGPNESSRRGPESRF